MIFFLSKYSTSKDYFSFDNI